MWIGRCEQGGHAKLPALTGVMLSVMCSTLMTSLLRTDKRSSLSPQIAADVLSTGGHITQAERQLAVAEAAVQV